MVHDGVVLQPSVLTNHTKRVVRRIRLDEGPLYSDLRFGSSNRFNDSIMGHESFRVHNLRDGSRDVEVEYHGESW